MKNILNALRAVAREHPIRVRAAVASVLVLVGQLVPAVADVVGSVALVDAMTGIVIVLLGADAARVVAKDVK